MDSNLKKKIDDILFWVAYVAALMIGITYKSFLAQEIKPAIRFVYIGIWGILFLKELLYIIRFKIKKEELIGIVLSVVLLLIILISKDISEVIVTGVFVPIIYCSRNIKFDKIAKVTIAVELAVLLLIMILAFTGVINDFSTLLFDEDGILVYERARMYLGFLYPLYPANILFNVILLYLCLKEGRISWWKAVLLLAVNTMMFLATGSRFSYFLSSGIVIYAWMKSYDGGNYKAKAVLKYSAIVSFAISLISALVYTDKISIMSKVNGILGNRLALAKNGFSEFGVHLTGKNTIMYGNGFDMSGQILHEELYNWVDNAWLNTLFSYGIIYLIIMLVLYVLVLKRLYIEKKYFIMIAISVVMIMMIIDDCMNTYIYNTFMFLAAGLMVKGNPDKK